MFRDQQETMYVLTSLVTTIIVSTMMHQTASNGPNPKSLQEEIRKRSPFEAPEQEAYLSVMRTASVLDAEFERFFKGYGLSIATFNVLRILRGAGEQGRMCHEIRDHMVAQVPDITRLVDRLEAAELAERCRCEKDRRVVHCRITAKGLELLGTIDQSLMGVHRAQMGHMSTEELMQLSKLLFKARHPPRPLDHHQESPHEERGGRRPHAAAELSQPLSGESL
ncbi:MAG: MarR family winged helix-turn-helix transcriptional regulator [Phycisphaerales bacterium]